MEGFHREKRWWLDVREFGERLVRGLVVSDDCQDWNLAILRREWPWCCCCCWIMEMRGCGGWSVALRCEAASGEAAS